MNVRGNSPPGSHVSSCIGLWRAAIARIDTADGAKPAAGKVDRDWQDGVALRLLKWTQCDCVLRADYDSQRELRLA